MTKALVLFKETVPNKELLWWQQFDTVVAPLALESAIRGHGLKFVSIENLTETGSINEASAFAQELSQVTRTDGTRLSKAVSYEGYELWWVHYNTLYLYFCLPYTQYKKLLSYLKDFQSISLYGSPYQNLFSYYLGAQGCTTVESIEPGAKNPSRLPLGVLLQIIITLFCIPLLMLQKRRMMLFTGDKFEAGRDYDARLKFIYQEVRRKNIRFVEFVRSLENWKTVLVHFFTRRRPIVYSEGVLFVGRFISFLSGGRRRAMRAFGAHTFASEKDPEKRFRLLVASQYLLGVYDDIWAIRIMQWILRRIGVRGAFIPAANERDFHTVLGCKLNGIPSVGILHGAVSKDYAVCDFLPGFDGEKTLSVDRYGLWSEWWKEYYLKYSDAYRPEQLFVSGPMRPLAREQAAETEIKPTGKLRVLFVAEQLAVPQEVMPYLEKLLQNRDIDLAIKFRPYRDGFEEWLKAHRPDILAIDTTRIFRGSVQDAVREHDVIIGSLSTAVLEGLLQYKVPIFFNTRKWGDCYDLQNTGVGQPFFAEDPDALIAKISQATTISKQEIQKLQDRFFGNPYRNGSAWAVEEVEKYL